MNELGGFREPGRQQGVVSETRDEHWARKARVCKGDGDGCILPPPSYALGMEWERRWWWRRVNKRQTTSHKAACALLPSAGSHIFRAPATGKIDRRIRCSCHMPVNLLEVYLPPHTFAPFPFPLTYIPASEMLPSVTNLQFPSPVNQ